MQTEQDPDMASTIRTAVQWANRVVNQKGEDIGDCIESTGWKQRPETIPVVVSAIHGKSENSLS